MPKSNDTSEVVFLVVMMTTIGLIAGLLIGIYIKGANCDKEWKEKALQAGHAKHYVTETGELRWGWFPSCKDLHGKED